MARALRIVLLLGMLLALPYPIAAADPLDVSFEVVRVTPTSATIRATISGATGPLDVTCRIDPLDRSGRTEPVVRGVQVARVERVASYRDAPEYQTNRIPIADAITTLEAEVAALSVTKGLRADEKQQKEEERRGKETELEALTAAQLQGATHHETQEIVAHRYTLETRERLVRYATCDEGDTIMLPAQAARESPPGQLLSENELTLDQTTVNWGDGIRVYEYTVETDDARDVDGWGSAGILVLTINGQDYYDDHNSSWWNETWAYRMKLTIDNSASTDDLTDFPLMVKLTPDRFDYSWCQWDGDDIRFVDSDGTALDYELDTWDRDDESFFWVRVPNIPAGATDDYVWLYFGNATVANGENAEGVWDDNYVAVYHMNDKPGDATMILDSTANANHGTKGAGAAAPTETAGTVGRAQQFVAASGQYIDCGNGASLDITGAMSMTVFLTPAAGDWPNDGYVLSKRDDPNLQFGMYMDAAAATRRVRVLGGSTVTPLVSGLIASGSPLYIGVSISGTSGSIRANDAVTSGTISALVSRPATRLVVGARWDGYPGVARLFNGLQCELRLSSVARSAEWIEAENLALTDALLTYGDTEGMPEAVTDEPVVPLATALLVVAVGVVAVKQNHVILYTAAFILLLFSGFALWDTTMPLAIMCCLYAAYMLYAATLALGGRR